MLVLAALVCVTLIHAQQITGPTTYCSSDETTNIYTVDGGFTVQNWWSSVTTVGSGNSATVTFPTWATAGSYVITAGGTYSDGSYGQLTFTATEDCGTTTGQVTSPCQGNYALNIGKTTDLCQGTSMSFWNDGHGFTSYEWFVDEVAVGTGTNYAHQLENNFQIKLVGTGTDCTTEVVEDITIVSTDFEIVGATEICPESTHNYTTNKSEEYTGTFAWEIYGAPVTFAPTQGISTDLSFGPNPAAGDRVVATYTSPEGCTNTEELSVALGSTCGEQAEVEIVGETTVCNRGNTYVYTLEGVSSVDSWWSNGNTVITSSANTATVTFNQAAQSQFTLTAGYTHLGQYQTKTINLTAFCPLVVTTVDDVVDANDNKNSLREAIQYANTAPGADVITFAIEPINGADQQYIINVGATFEITEELTIDAPSQEINADGNKKVNLVSTFGAATGATPTGQDAIFYAKEMLTLNNLELTGVVATNDVGIFSNTSGISIALNDVNFNSFQRAIDLYSGVTADMNDCRLVDNFVGGFTNGATLNINSGNDFLSTIVRNDCALIANNSAQINVLDGNTFTAFWYAFVVDAKAKVTMIGSNFYSNRSFGIRANDSEVNLTDVSFIGDQTAVGYYNNSTGTIQGTTIEAESTSDIWSIFVENSTLNMNNGNILSGVGTYGIGMAGTSNVSLTGTNTISDKLKGIIVNGTTTFNIDGATLSNNTTGLSIEGTNSVTVENSIFDNNLSFGIQVAAECSLEVIGSEFKNHQASPTHSAGIEVKNGHLEVKGGTVFNSNVYGISAIEGADVTVSEATFSGGGFATSINGSTITLNPASVFDGVHTGIYTIGESVVIAKGNTFKNITGVAVSIRNESTGTISDNNVFETNNFSVLVEDNGAANVSGNSFTGNSEGGHITVKNSDGTTISNNTFGVNGQTNIKPITLAEAGNNSIPFPLINPQITGSTTITGTANGYVDAAGSTIELFLTDGITVNTGHSQTTTQLVNVNTPIVVDANGNWAYDKDPDLQGYLTATMTDANGNTSELGVPTQVTAGCNLIVKNTNDSGVGSLREAIICANNTPGHNTITFDFSLSNAPLNAEGQYVINAVSAMTTVTEATTIDATGLTNVTLNGLPKLLITSALSNGDGVYATDEIFLRANDPLTFKGIHLKGEGQTDTRGFLIASGDIAVIENCVVEGYARGIYVASGSTLDMSLSTVKECSFTGVYLNGTTMNSEGNIFDNNKYCVGVYNEGIINANNDHYSNSTRGIMLYAGGIANVENSTFDAIASLGIFVSEGRLALNDGNLFTNNYYGVGVYYDQSSITTFGNNTFEGNSSGIFLKEGAQGTIIGATFSGNVTGINANTGTNITVANSVFNNNTTGAIYLVTDVVARLSEGNSFSGNKNGVYASNSVISVAKDNVFSANERGLVGANSSFTVEGSTFNDNTVYGCYMTACSLDISRSTFLNNIGGIAGYGGSDVIASANTVEGSAYGLVLSASTATVNEGNLFLQNGRGLYGLSNAIITVDEGNTFEANDYGTYSHTGQINITGSLFKNNVQIGVYAYDAIVTVEHDNVFENNRIGVGVYNKAIVRVAGNQFRNYENSAIFGQGVENAVIENNSIDMTGAGYGVRFMKFTVNTGELVGDNNKITQNTIFTTTPSTALPIYFDASANNDMPPPILSYVESDRRTITLLVDGEQGQVVEFFGSTGANQANEYIRYGDRTLNSGEPETVIIPRPEGQFEYVTATARNTQFNTSLLSGIIAVPLTCSQVVTSLSDASNGDGALTTLREAITCASEAEGETVTFDPSLDGGTIFLESKLDINTALTTIDGSGIDITIDGSQSQHATGFLIPAERATIKGLTLQNFETGVIVQGNEVWIQENKILETSSTGIYVQADKALIQGNFIKNTINPLTAKGIWVLGGADEVQIGGDIFNEKERNMIHGMKNGIYVSSSQYYNATSNTGIYGNIIGSYVQLPGDCDNSDITIKGAANKHGIYIDQKANTVEIGRERSGEFNANIIAGNTEKGILNRSNYPYGVGIYGNYIGVDLCGNFIGTQKMGVYLHPETKGTIIGGFSQYDGNIIAGNSEHAIDILGDDHQINGNIIGTDRIGSTGLGNTYAPRQYYDAGVFIEQGTANITFSNNTLVSDAYDALRVRGVDHQIVNNKFGYAKNANLENIILPNKIAIRFLGADSINFNDNTILGSTSTGVSIQGLTNSEMKRNFIGVTEDGSLEAGNNLGIYTYYNAGYVIHDVLVGGDINADANYIVGGTNNIVITSGHDLTFKGNYVGITKQGKTFPTVTDYGFDIQTTTWTANSNQGKIVIGGDHTKGEGNVISGHKYSGIAINGDANESTNNIEIYGNTIGLDATGSYSEQYINGVNYNYSNEGHGIYGNSNSGGITIGSDDPNYSNVIANSGINGIRLDGINFSSTIKGNFIGTSREGFSFSNIGGGIKIAGATDVTIGGIEAGAGNTIVNNGPFGLTIRNAAKNINSVGNIIFNQDFGYTASNTTVPQLIPEPVIQSIIRKGADELEISLTSADGTIIDVYAVEDNNEEHIREYIGRSVLGNGATSITVAHASQNYKKYRVTAARPDGSGVSSKFSNTVEEVEEPSTCVFEDWVVPVLPDFGNQKSRLEKTVLTITQTTSELDTQHELYITEGQEAWTFVRQLRFEALDENDQPLKGQPYRGEFIISSKKPTSRLHIDISDITYDVKKFRISCDGDGGIPVVTPGFESQVTPQIIADMSRLYLETEYQSSLATISKNGKGIFIHSPSVKRFNNDEEFSLATFSWSLPTAMHFNNYDLQVLKLEPEMDDDNISVDVDWSKAALIEIEDLTHDGTTAYEMTLAEGTGFYVWRVRPIGNYYEGGRSNALNYGQWSSIPSTDNLYSGSNAFDLSAQIGSNSVNTNANGVSGGLFYYEQFNEDVNFIYSKVLSENSRKAETITYANGLSMTEQVQTKLQSKGEVLATQSVQDYVGRPALNTLPAPVNQEELGYSQSFLLNTSGDPYTAADYDATGLLYNPNALSSVKGTPSFYYSNANSDNDYTYGDRVPDAGGVPYSRSVFTNDPSGRQKQSAAPGAVNKLADPKTPSVIHNDLITYASVDQQELDQVFGPEAPLEQNVFKTISSDPNGVTSIAYMTKSGETIATCLNNGATLENMVNSSTGEKPITGSLNDSPLDKENGIAYASKKISYVGSGFRSYTFDYDLSPKTFMMDGPNGECDICETCDYNLEIQVTDIDAPENPVSNATLYLKWVSSDICTTPVTQHLNNFDIVAGEGAYEEIFGVTAEQTEMTSSFTIDFKKGNYIIEKRLYTKNRVEGTNRTYLEDKIDQVEAYYDDWTVDNQIGCYNDFVAEVLDTDVGCNSSIYCDGVNFPQSGTPTFDLLHNKLYEIRTEELNIIGTYNTEFLSNGGLTTLVDGVDDFDILSELIIDVSDQGISCVDFANSMLAVREIMVANKNLIEGGSLPARLYSAEQPVFSADVDNMVPEIHDDEFDYIRKVLEYSGLEGGLKHNIYCYTPTASMDYDFYKEQLTSSNKKLSYIDNLTVYWNDNINPTSCANGNIATAKGYLKIPTWAKELGGPLSFRIRLVEGDYVMLILGDEQLELGNGYNTIDHSITITEKDYLEIDFLMATLNKDAIFSVQWFKDGEYQQIPLYNFIPFCSIKNDLVLYRGSGVKPRAVNLLTLDIPEQTEYTDDPAPGSYHSGVNMRNIVASELVKGIYADASLMWTSSANILSPNNLLPALKMSEEEAIQTICEAYYNTDVYIVDDATADDLDIEFSNKLEEACLTHCAESGDLYHQALDNYLVEQNALIGNSSPTFEIDQLTGISQLQWKTDFDGYNDADRECMVESIMDNCMNHCLSGDPDDMIKVMNGYPIFNPKGNGAISMDQFKIDMIDYVNETWASILSQRVENEPLPEDDVFRFNDPTAVRNMVTKTVLVYSFDDNQVQQYHEYKIYVGATWFENGPGLADDVLKELVFKVRNMHLSTNIHRLNTDEMFNLDFAGLASGGLINDAQILSGEKQFFDIYFDSNRWLHVVPLDGLKAALDLETALDLDARLGKVPGQIRYVTMADYNATFGINLHGFTSDMNFSTSDYFDAAIVFGNESIDLFDTPVYWNNSYRLTENKDNLLQVIVDRINNTDNDLTAEILPTFGENYIRLYLKNHNDLDRFTEFILQNNSTVPVIDFHTQGFYNYPNLDITYPERYVLLPVNGRYLDGMNEAIHDFLDEETTVSDISGYQQDCPLGFNGVGAAQGLNPALNLLSNGNINSSISCHDANNSVDRFYEAIFDNCLEGWSDGSNNLQNSADFFDDNVTSSNSVPAGMVSGSIHFWGQNTSAYERICTPLDVKAGDAFKFQAMIEYPRISYGDNNWLSDEMYLVMKLENETDIISAADHLLTSVTAHEVINQKIEKIDGWNRYEASFVADDDYKQVCIYPLNNVETGTYQPSILIDDLIINRVAPNHANIDVLKVAEQMKDKLIPHLYEVFDKRFVRGADLTQQDRFVEIINTPTSSQWIEVVPTYHSLYQVINGVEIVLYDTCNGVANSGTLKILLPWDLTRGRGRHSNIEEYINFSFDEGGALVIQMLTNECHGQGCLEFQTLSTTFPGGVILKRPNGTIRQQINSGNSFWQGLFDADASCQPDFGSCEACLKWEPLESYVADLFAQIDADAGGHTLFPQKDETICEIEEQYIADQVQTYLEEKLATMREEAVTNFNTSCVQEIEDELSYSYMLGNYHYTRYLYDRAGNLIETVPPQETDLLLGSALTGLTNQRRANTHLDHLSYEMDYDLNTSYEYNSISQLQEQTTPDGGTSKFFYNVLGQLVLSQDAAQAVRDEDDNGIIDGVYSYTIYDELGRIVEVGELEGYTTFEEADFWESAPATGGDVSNSFPYAEGLTTVEVSRTFYSTPAVNIEYEGQTQQYLRNRISYVERDVDGNVSTREDNYRTYYSYDPHGNVQWLIQDIPELGQKSIAYEYDLVSGNVTKVSYQANTTEQFYHAYSYDEDNRIQSVRTSIDGYTWSEDAKYDYFLHGPIARTELGHDHIQGCDYTYTIEGYLKAINEGSLTTVNDPGKDGHTLEGFLPDEFGMELGYYDGDFNRTGVAIGKGATTDPWQGVLADNEYGLHNGNVAYWIANTRSAAGDASIAGAHMRAFRYDKLNRLRVSDFIEMSGAAWDNTQKMATASIDAIGKFDESFTYDNNGNISTTKRFDGGSNLIDNLSYHYIGETAQGQANELNQLAYVTEGGAMDIQGIDDIKSQNSGNYIYDAEGNMTGDASEHIDIEWNVLNKVSKITNSENHDVISFAYDASGNRVAKNRTSTADNDDDGTYYVRDASGNVMAVYEKTATPSSTIMKLKELPIYGSDRIGQYTPINNEVYSANTLVNTSNYDQYLVDNSVEIGQETPTYQSSQSVEHNTFNAWPYSDRYIAFDGSNKETLSNGIEGYHFVGASAIAEDNDGTPVAQFRYAEIPGIGEYRRGSEVNYYDNITVEVGGDPIWGPYDIDYSSRIGSTVIEDDYYLNVGETVSDLIEDKTYYAITYDGYLYFPETGVYTLRLSASPMASFELDGNEVLNKHWDGQYKFVTLTVTQGFHEYHQELFGHQGDAYVGVNWKKPGTTSYSPVLDYLFYKSDRVEERYLSDVIYQEKGFVQNGDPKVSSSDNYWPLLTNLEGEEYSGTEEIMGNKSIDPIIMNVPGQESQFYMFTTSGNQVLRHRFNSVGQNVEDVNVPVPNIVLTGSQGKQYVSMTAINDQLSDDNKLFVAHIQNSILKIEAIDAVKLTSTTTIYSKAIHPGAESLQELQLSPDGNTLYLVYTNRSGNNFGKFLLKLDWRNESDVSVLLEEIEPRSFDYYEHGQVREAHLKEYKSYDVDPSGENIYFLEQEIVGTTLADMAEVFIKNFEKQTSLRKHQITKYELGTGTKTTLDHTYRPINTQAKIRRGKDGNMYYAYTGGSASSKLNYLYEIDAQGNRTRVMYNVSNSSAQLPTNIYRKTPFTQIDQLDKKHSSCRLVGSKVFELKDHLGNVRSVIGDGRVSTFDANGIVLTANVDVRSYTDYYAFGWAMPERQSTGDYRYGFNGKERTDEISGEGVIYDYGFRIYDSRIGKFMSVDPLADNYPWNSVYAYAENDVVRCIDLDGLEKVMTIWSPYVKKAVQDYLAKRNFKGAIGALQYGYNSAYWVDKNGDPSNWYQDLKSTDAMKVPTKKSVTWDSKNLKYYNEDGEPYSRQFGDGDYVVLEFQEPGKKPEIIGVIPLALAESDGSVTRVTQEQFDKLKPVYNDEEKNYEDQYKASEAITKMSIRTIATYLEIPFVDKLMEIATVDERLAVEKEYLTKRIGAALRGIEGNSATSIKITLTDGYKYQINAERTMGDKGSPVTKVDFIKLDP